MQSEQAMAALVAICANLCTLCGNLCAGCVNLCAGRALFFAGTEQVCIFLAVFLCET
jgi:hypothetical protein